MVRFAARRGSRPAVLGGIGLSVVGVVMASLGTRLPVCKTCNLDPLNRLTDELRGVAQGGVTMEDAEAMAADMLRVNQAVHEGLARLDARTDPAPAPRRRRRLIPLRSG